MRRGSDMEKDLHAKRPDILRHFGRIVGHRHGELHVVGFAKSFAPRNEGLRHTAIFADDLVQPLNKYMGNVKIAGVQAADKAPQQRFCVNGILLRVD